MQDVRLAMTDLHDTQAMILDIRINGGGYDGVGLEIARYFTSTSFDAFTKKAVTTNGSFTPEASIVIDPIPDESLQYLSKPVILITSGTTASAAEIFTMTMAELPQVTLLGDNTSGELSDMLVKILPNLWTFTLSNEVYLTPGGDLYEMVGIPPEIRPKTLFMPLQEREEGRDSWMELALESAMERIALKSDDDVSTEPSTSPSVGSNEDSDLPSSSMGIAVLWPLFAMMSGYLMVILV